MREFGFRPSPLSGDDGALSDFNRTCVINRSRTALVYYNDLDLKQPPGASGFGNLEVATRERLGGGRQPLNAVNPALL